MTDQGRAAEQEDVLEPDLEIVDPHHHLWDHPGWRYLLPELLADVGSGHKVVQTVFLECNAMYRSSGPDAFKTVGEVEFVNGAAASSASGLYGPARLCEGIVGKVDLTLGEAAKPVLEAQMRAAGDRFKGIRVATPWAETPFFGQPFDIANQTRLADPQFREGFALLEPLGLSFDAWLFHTQIDGLVDLARAFPGTTIILDHFGSPMAKGPENPESKAVYAAWKTAMAGVASCPNIAMKMGGLGMNTFGSPAYKADPAWTSRALAAEWAPYIETSIEMLGVDRCMFESNFPVDGPSCSYRTLWNAFKHVTASASAAEKAALYSGTARRVYRLPAPVEA